jgi:hypothetical protein
MAGIGDLIKGVMEGVEAFKKPSALPDIAERGTAAAPRVLEEAMQSPGHIAQRNLDVPFPGPEGVRKIVRATEAPSHTAVEVPGVGALDDPGPTLKNFLKGFITRDPEVTPSVMQSSDIGEKLYRGAWRSEIAPEVADRDVSSWLDPLKRDPVKQAALLSDYHTTMDEWAQGARDGKTQIRGIPIDIWKATADQLQKRVDADPEVAAASKNVRTNLDAMFQDMVSRGWIERDRYLGDYTPIRKLHSMLDGLAKFTGEDPQALRNRLLSAQQSRGNSRLALRETDLVDLLRRHRAEYLSKIAQHEAFTDIIADPTVNFTDKFSGRADLPQDLAVYRPGPGMFGSTAKTAEGYLLDHHLKAIDPQGHIAAGGYILPKRLVQALQQFDKRQLHGTEHTISKMGGALAKWLTVYNPANTQINRASDLLVAMFYPGEGESAHPLGVLRWYGDGAKAGYKIAFNGGQHLVTLHGQTVDVTDLAMREGLASSTVQHLVGGQRMPVELARFAEGGDAAYKAWQSDLFAKMEADRLATELSPRIAAGLEAVQRTGDWSQFGRVGRDVTFRYGAGAPRNAQQPILKMMAPFLQFQGLATQRMLQTWGAGGAQGKARLALGLTAVPLAINAWNTQNDAYKQAELSLPSYERNQMHIWMPGSDPAKPRLDVTGRPVSLRFRLWVPDQVAQSVGLGNAAPRALRVFQGRDTPMQFAKESAQQAGDQLSSNLVIPQAIQQLVGSSPGMPDKSPAQRVERLVPLARTAAETIGAAKNYGMSEATWKFLQGMTGLRPSGVRTKGGRLLDAQFMEARSNLMKAKAAVMANRTGDPDKLRDATKQMTDAVAEIKRLREVMKNEKAAGYSPPARDATPPPSADVDREILREMTQGEQK